MVYCEATQGSDHCGRCGLKVPASPSLRICVTQQDRARLLRKFGRGDRIKVPDVNLGDKVEWALKKVGITEELVKKITGKKDCGCPRRRSKMNAASNEFAFQLQRFLNGAADFVLGEPIDEEAERLARELTARMSEKSPVDNK